jgi:hypothetical protein
VLFKNTFSPVSILYRYIGVNGSLFKLLMTSGVEILNLYWENVAPKEIVTLPNRNKNMSVPIECCNCPCPQFVEQLDITENSLFFGKKNAV